MRTYSKKLSPSQSPYWRLSTVPFSSDSMATGPVVAVEGFTSGRCLEVANAPTLEPLSSPVVAANGEQLKICGLSNVSLWVGDLCACCPILLVKSIMQNCLTCDRLSGKKLGCIIDLQERTLTTRMSVPLHFWKTQSASICQWSSLTVIPGRHQLELPAQLKPHTGELVGVLEPGRYIMVMIARSDHSVSAGKEGSWIRVLNPSPAPVTMCHNERLGILQPLEPALESAALEEIEAGSPNNTKTLGQVIQQLQSRLQRTLWGREQSTGDIIVSISWCYLPPQSKENSRLNCLRRIWQDI